MYSKFLSDEAKEAVKDKEIGTLADQILFMRGKIYDIMKLKEKQDADPEKLDIEGRSVTTTDSGSESVTVTHRKRDYDKALLDAIKQLESLEKTHAALMAEKAKNDTTVRIEGGLPDIE